MRILQTSAIILSVATVLAACSSTPKAPEAANSTPVPVKQSDSHAVATVNAASIDPLDDPKGVLAQRSVYFDYDSYLIKTEYTKLVNAHANYLEKNKARTVLIQGNTDERGGSEYNLALGQKRAEAVRKSMATLGVSNGQMEAVSLGKEKPKANGHDEAAWSQNRRADIVYNALEK